MTGPLLEIRNLHKSFPIGAGLFGQTQFVRAVDDVSFTINVGETLGLVGESGSGKSTIGQMVVRLTTPTGGTILFEGRDVASFGRKDQRNYAGAVQIIFQDPYSSLNPQRTVEDALMRPLLIHEPAMNKRQRKERMAELLAEAGLITPEKYLHRYPHQMSGGERQRVAIARALSTRPRLIVADEAVSSLDVSIRAQLLNLLKDLQARHKLSFLFITHDLATLGHISQRVAVMYLGQLVEVGPASAVLGDPKHPYTKALLAAVPIADPDLARRKRFVELTGPLPSAISPPLGCRFHTRCPVAEPRCSVEVPPLILDGDRSVLCLDEIVNSKRVERAGC